jgi:hypothetical protein
MLFVVLGKRRDLEQLAVLALSCRPCGHPEKHGLYRQTTKFCVFFVPLFPVGVKYLLQCVACWSTYGIRREDADRLLDPQTDLASYEPASTDVAPPASR